VITQIRATVGHRNSVGRSSSIQSSATGLVGP
jgi:hypothetical protein